MGKIRVTGTMDAVDLDTSDPMGLSEEAYLRLSTEDFATLDDLTFTYEP